MVIHTLYGDCRPAVAFALNLLGPGCRCMEIGTQNGDHARIMCEVLKPSRMVCVDPWEDLDWKHINEVYTAESFSKAYNLLIPYKVELVRERSQTALLRMETDSFDFIYIDGEHARLACAQDIRNGLRLVRVGGVLGGHDYGPDTGIMGEDVDPKTAVSGALCNVFHGRKVFGDSGDWWVVVTKTLKKLAAVMEVQP